MVHVFEWNMICEVWLMVWHVSYLHPTYSYNTTIALHKLFFWKEARKICTLQSVCGRQQTRFFHSNRPLFERNTKMYSSNMNILIIALIYNKIKAQQGWRSTSHFIYIQRAPYSNKMFLLYFSPVSMISTLYHVFSWQKCTQQTISKLQPTCKTISTFAMCLILINIHKLLSPHYDTHTKFYTHFESGIIIGALFNEPLPHHLVIMQQNWYLMCFRLIISLRTSESEKSAAFPLAKS